MAISKDFIVKNGLQVGSSLQVNSTATFSNDVTISGNLTVSGTTTYVNTATLNIADNIVTLNADVSGATAPTENAGLEINRGSSANVQLRWNESTDSWEQSNAGLSVYYKLLSNNDILDSVVSTSIIAAASANSVKSAYDTAISQSSTAYSNATTYASNATNISSGTLNTARLPAQVNVSANLNIGAFGTTNGVNIQNTAIIVGNSTANATLSYNLVQASNSTSTANLSPTTLTIGSASVNSTTVTTTTVTATTVTANTTGIHTGNVSATVVNASANVNAPLVFANISGTYANLSGQVNTATLFATTSANVGGNVQITVSQYGITGNTTTAPTMALTGSALTIGNSTVTGAPSINLANSTGNTTVNVTSIGSSWGLISNASGVYHSGVINAASHTTATSVSNTSGFYPTTNALALGNSTGLWVISANSLGANSITVTGGNLNAATIYATSYNVGTSFIANSTTILGTGYAIVYFGVNSAAFTVGTAFTANSTLVNAAAINITGQVNTATAYAATSANVGGNVQITVSQYGITGNSTTAPTMSLTGSALTVGNSTVTGAPTINLANSTGNTTVNVTSIGTSWGLNSNSSGIYHSGVINAASYSVGTTFIANATLVNAAAINITGQVNTATFYAATSANVGANVQLTTSQLFIGNSTVNAVTNTSYTYIGNSSVYATIDLIAPAGVVVAERYNIGFDGATYGRTLVTNYNNTTITAARTNYGQQFLYNNFGLHANSSGVSTGAQLSDIYGLGSFVYNGNSASGGNARVDSMYGIQADVRNYANGTTANTINNAYGVNSVVRQYGSGTISTATGIIGSVTAGNSSVTGAITTAYGVRSGVTSNTGMTIGTSYLFYGTSLGASPSTNTTNYGVYCTGESNNYFSGNMRISGALGITGALTKGSGTFLIDHPLDPTNKDLYHGFVEAPRYDLIYRGEVTLENGSAEVDIDIASNMTPGTFDALTQNQKVTSLQNQTGFDRVKPLSIANGKFMIISESNTSNDTIVWVVMGERKDVFIKTVNNTDSDGRLIPEWDKEE